jgi:hypothetical protein
VLVAWFVLPVRSEGVLRRRLAAVLAAVDEAWRDSSADPQERARALEDLEQVAPPWQTLGRIPLARARRAAAWIAATELIARAEPAVPPRAELGAARRAVREREALLPALERVVAALGD